MINVKKAIQAVECDDLDLSSKRDLLRAIDIVDACLNMTKGHLETLRCCHFVGPVWDGNVPSKSDRDDLVRVGAIAKVSVKGEQGFNACTYRGYSFIQALQSLLETNND